uniref:Uncharacterized protein n=1 Tax=Stomoxys calcitrans TaxID=35570 RepID=A0A1I8PTD9_STOCA
MLVMKAVLFAFIFQSFLAATLYAGSTDYDGEYYYDSEVAESDRGQYIPGQATGSELSVDQNEETLVESDPLDQEFEGAPEEGYQLEPGEETNKLLQSICQTIDCQQQHIQKNPNIAFNVAIDNRTIKKLQNRLRNEDSRENSDYATIRKFLDRIHNGNHRNDQELDEDMANDDEGMMYHDDNHLNDHEIEENLPSENYSQAYGYGNKPHRKQHYRQQVPRSQMYLQPATRNHTNEFRPHQNRTRGNTYPPRRNGNVHNPSRTNTPRPTFPRRSNVPTNSTVTKSNGTSRNNRTRNQTRGSNRNVNRPMVSTPANGGTRAPRVNNQRKTNRRANRRPKTVAKKLVANVASNEHMNLDNRDETIQNILENKSSELESK